MRTEDGMSYRQIAEADGTVTYQTVTNSLVKNLTPDSADRITGKDGKSYPAYKPIRTAFMRSIASNDAVDQPETITGKDACPYARGVAASAPNPK
jgi:hypothetical protein